MNFYELPEADPEPDIKHLKLIAIHAEAVPIPNPSPGDPIVATLKFVPTYLNDGTNGAGQQVDPTKVEQEIENFVDSVPAAIGPTRGPLDFGIVHKCYIVIRLDGKFWEFVPEGAVTTKKEHANARYYNLRTHERAGRIVAVSFCARTPLKLTNPAQTGVKHGFNLHIDFVERDASGQVTRRLPVIIDPDVENRGG